MAYEMSRKKFDEYIELLSEEYRVYGPVTMTGKGKHSHTDVVGYKEVYSGKSLNFLDKSYYSPKEIIFPIRETLFHFVDGESKVPAVDTKPAVVFVRPCDINGIKRLDTIFLENGEIEDFYYKRRRELIKFVMIECPEGFDTCFCVSMDTNKTHEYDAVIRVKSDGITLDFKDKALEYPIVKEEKEVDFTVDFVKENKVKVTIPPVDKLTIDVFDHPVWKEYTKRCIACGRCNTSCITCSCFTMQDVYGDNNKALSERKRRWAGCHVDGFTTMAGGHKFRKKNGQKMRFKTMHKINDYYRRFGHHMCVGCGRCDDVCPEYISFSKCINKLNSIIKKGGESDE